MIPLIPGSIYRRMYFDSGSDPSYENVSPDWQTKMMEQFSKMFNPYMSGGIGSLLSPYGTTSGGFGTTTPSTGGVTAPTAPAATGAMDAISKLYQGGTGGGTATPMQNYRSQNFPTATEGGATVKNPNFQSGISPQVLGQPAAGGAITPTTPTTGTTTPTTAQFPSYEGSYLNEYTSPYMSEYTGQLSAPNYSTDPLYQSASTALQTILSGTDPLTSDYWSGYQAESDIQKQDALDALARTSSMGGWLYSDPYQRAYGDTEAQYSADQMQQLGVLEQQNIQNMMTAAPIATQMAQGVQQVDQAALDRQYKEWERAGGTQYAESMRSQQAQYSEWLRTQELTYNDYLRQQQSWQNLLGMLMGYAPETVVYPGQESNTGDILKTLGTVGAAAITGGASIPIMLGA